MSYRIGIDIGGTFTDFALQKGTELALHKNLSCRGVSQWPSTKARRVLAALAALALSLPAQAGIITVSATRAFSSSYRERSSASAFQ